MMFLLMILFQLSCASTAARDDPAIGRADQPRWRGYKAFCSGGDEKDPR